MSIERQIKIEGELTLSPKGHQPRAYRHEGRGEYHLECYPSGLRTATYPTLQQAVEAWEGQQMVTVLRGPRE